MATAATPKATGKDQDCQRLDWFFMFYQFSVDPD
jgi:hypothetical protein